MLPLYPKAKSGLRSLAIRVFNHSSETENILDIPNDPIYEGDSSSYTRDDGSEHSVEFTTYQSRCEISEAEYQVFTWKEVLARFQDLGRRRGTELFTDMLTEIKSITEETGNTFDAGGRMTPEIFLKMIEKKELRFDSSGKPKEQFILSSQEGARQASEVLTQIFATPDLKRQYDELISKKRELWRDRENNRRLVG